MISTLLRVAAAFVATISFACYSWILFAQRADAAYLLVYTSLKIFNTLFDEIDKEICAKFVVPSEEDSM